MDLPEERHLQKAPSFDQAYDPPAEQIFNDKFEHQPVKQTSGIEGYSRETVGSVVSQLDGGGELAYSADSSR